MCKNASERSKYSNLNQSIMTHIIESVHKPTLALYFNFCSCARETRVLPSSSREREAQRLEIKPEFIK